MNTLHEQQRSFAKFMLAGGDAQTDAELLALELPALKQSTSSRFKSSQRLQVYQNNFVLSLRETLSAVYPVVFKLVGDVFFQHVARKYIQDYPSRTGNLHDFGDKFANYLERFPGLETLPYLPDVARLEWAYHRVFHSPEGGVLNLAALAALDETQMGELMFQLSSSCVCLSSGYPILRIWQANQSEQDIESVSLDEGGVQFIVLRHDQQIEFHPLSAGVFAIIHSLSQNKVFSQACVAALEVEVNCDIAAALQYLVKQKIVCGFSHLPATSPDQEDYNDVG